MWKCVRMRKWEYESIHGIIRNHFLPNGFLNRFCIHTLSACAEVKLMCLSYVFHSFLRSFNMLPHRFIFRCCCLFVLNFINWYTFNAFICGTVCTHTNTNVVLVGSIPVLSFDSIRVKKSYLQRERKRKRKLVQMDIRLKSYVKNFIVLHRCCCCCCFSFTIKFWIQKETERMRGRERGRYSRIVIVLFH